MSSDVIIGREVNDVVVIILRPESSPNEFKELSSFVGAGVNDGLLIFLSWEGASICPCHVFQQHASFGSQVWIAHLIHRFGMFISMPHHMITERNRMFSECMFSMSYCHVVWQRSLQELSSAVCTSTTKEDGTSLKVNWHVFGPSV